MNNIYDWEANLIVTVDMPGGGTDNLNSNAVLLLRDSTALEREAVPDAPSYIRGTNFEIFPAEPLAALVAKLNNLKLANLTNPSGGVSVISASKVVDRSDPRPILHHERAKSVLEFGTGPRAFNVQVQESESELVAIWTDLGLPTHIVESGA